MERLVSNAKWQKARVSQDKETGLVLLEIIEDGNVTVRLYIKPDVARQLARDMLDV